MKLNDYLHPHCNKKIKAIYFVHNPKLTYYLIFI